MEQIRKNLGGGGTTREATSEITADEGEAAVPGDVEADDFKDENEKDEQDNGDEGSGLGNGIDQDGEKGSDDEENSGEKDGEESSESEKNQENGKEPGENEDQAENSSDDKDDLEGEDQETGESSEEEEKDPEDGVEEDTPKDEQENARENETELAEDDSLKEEDKKELVPEIPEVVVEEKEQKEKEEKILSWKWKDEQESLIEGELRLSVTEEDHIAFEEIEAMLPAEVTASVSVEDDEEESEKDTEDIEDAENTEETAKTEKTKETDIPVLGWTCEDYVQDENGKWPTSGEFIFKAELLEEYVLADGVNALEVKVVLEVPGVALLENETLSGKIKIDEQSDFQLSGDKYVGDHFEITKLGDDEYNLSLDGFNGTNIIFECGNWTVELDGTNYVNNPNGEGLYICQYGLIIPEVTIKGEGTLEASGTTYGIFIDQNTSLTIDGGTIITNGGSSDSSKRRTAGIEIEHATLTVNGGDIKATGTCGSGKGYGINMLYASTMDINGGSITAVGTESSLFMAGTVNVSDGTLTTDTFMFDEYFGYNNKLYITGSGEVEITSKLHVCGTGSPSMEIENGGTLTVNEVDNKGNVTLNNGNLILNGTFTNSTNNTNQKKGSFDYQSGSVTGNGSLPRESKLPVTISISNDNTDIAVPGGIDVSKYFTVVSPSEAGDIRYSVDYTDIARNDRGEGKLTGTILTVTKPGKLNVKATVSETEFYAESSEKVTFTVNKGKLDNSDVTVTSYNGAYDNEEHDAVTVTVEKSPAIQNMKVLYAPYDGSTEPEESAYSEIIPKVKNVSDTGDGKQYYIWIKSDNYEDIKMLSETVRIQPLTHFDSELLSSSAIYDGTDQMPKVKAIYKANDDVFWELVEGEDYTVTSDLSGSVIDVGTYTITVTGKGNYDCQYQFPFTVSKFDLSNALVSFMYNNVYNSTPQTLAEDQIKVETSKVVIPSDDYKLTYSNNTNAGDQAEVTITAKTDFVNFTGSKTVNFSIEKAPLTIAGAVLEPKTYDKTADAIVQSVQFKGLCGSDQFTDADYTASAAFTDVNAGIDKEVVLNVSLNQTSAADNYELSDGVYHLYDQTIQKAPAPTLPDTSVSYTFGATGERIVDISPLFLDDCGEMTAMTAAVTSDDIQALDPQVTTDLQAKTVAFRLLGNKKENIGKTAEITVSGIETTNYQDMTAKVIVTLGAKKEQDAPQIHMTCYPNSDGETFTAEITTVADAEYSFDGINWSDNNVKSDCLGGELYTGYIRMKENEEEYASPFAKMDLTVPKQTVKTPVITPESGRFHGLQQIEISCATADAKIYYTVDGTEPTAESTLYTGPFTISQSATVKAVAVKEHMADSALAEAVFEYDSSKDSDGSSWESSSSKTIQSGQKGTLADTPAQDDKKGWISTALGIITGEENGYSHWEKTENNWKLRYADGTYVAGTMETAADGTVYEQPHWEMVNGKWYAFGADQYAKDGWVYDRSYGTWFYIDIDRGMYTGWVFINGKWYYFHPVSDGRKGAMYKNQQTPDGYYVDENGAWMD